MKHEVLKTGPQCVVRCIGDLDVSNADELAGVLQEAEHESAHVVLDLQAVSFIDSTAIGSLVGSTRRLRERGGNLQLLVSSPHILRVLRATNLDSVIVVVDASATVTQP